MLRLGRKGLLAVFLSLLVLAAAHGDFRPSDLDMTVAPHKYSLVGWEIGNFFDKWTRKLSDLMPWTSEPSRQEKISQVNKYFELGERIRDLERRSRSAESVSSKSTPVDWKSSVSWRTCRKRSWWEPC